MPSRIFSARCLRRVGNITLAHAPCIHGQYLIFDSTDILCPFRDCLGLEAAVPVFYTFLFVDCIYVTIRKDMETKNCAVYVVLGYDADGIKDVLGLWVGESEGKHYWMQIFDEIRARGVEFH